MGDSGGDLAALQEIYEKLKQDAQALQLEWREVDILADQFEVDFLEEQTVKELYVAGGSVLGLSIFHTTAKAILPTKAAITITSGAWVLAGAFIIFRVTASTAAGWSAMTKRNAQRKKLLKRKLEIVQRQIHALAAGLPYSTETEGKKDASGSGTLPRPSPSPSPSSGSSIELVEAPNPEDFQGGSSGSSPVKVHPGGGEQGAGTEADEAERGGVGARKASSLESWKQYASLGRHKGA